MTKEMRLIFEKGKWNDKRDTPAAAPPPCRLHFLMFSALHAEKAALLRRKNAFGRTTAFLAPRMPSQNKKAIPYGMTFCFGGDKRDRTADLMTARVASVGSRQNEQKIQEKKMRIYEQIHAA